IFGDGGQTRSFCYVTDLIEGLLRLARVERNPSGPVNIGNPGEFTVAELAEIIAELVPQSRGVRHLPLPQDDPKRRRPDISRAAALLGWAPQIKLRNGLARTVEWFAECVDRAAKLEAAE